jgi:mRNA interferase RelE/StbE
MGLLFHPDALASIPQKDAERTKEKVDWLWANRHIVHHSPLRENLSGFCKRRVGQYRIIYTYDADQDNMVVCLVGSRDDIYKKRLP